MAVSTSGRKRTSGRSRLEPLRAALGSRSIVLIGLMGAGKSAIGRRLAGKLSLDFVDADAEIEEAAGKSITDIFAEHGEAYFRDGERKVIARLLRGGPQVLATGGGAYMNEQTREAIRKHGISVWLKAEVDLLLSRVRRRETRPLLMAGEPKAIMKDLMRQRYPIYAEADITVRSRDVPHDVIVTEIITALQKKFPTSPSNGAKR